MKYLTDEGHFVFIMARKKDVTVNLLEHYGFDFIAPTKPGRNKLEMLQELVKRDKIVFDLHRKYKFDLAFGTSVSIAHLSAVAKVKSFVFNEDDDDVVPFFSYLTYPFATKIVCPDCTKYSKWSKKRILHESYHELAYLHPDIFKPNISILNKYSLKKYDYVILRLSSLLAHHDKGVKGINKTLMEKIIKICSDLKIIYSIEGKQNCVIKPWDMHHVMAFARFVISDSQTMTAESAVLGTPSIRVNSFIGKIGYLNEIEFKYLLSYGFFPNEIDSALKKINSLISNANSSSEWRKKQKILLKDKINLSEWMKELL